MLIDNTTGTRIMSSVPSQHIPSECNQSTGLPLFVKGIVVKGFGRGSKRLGCPTANISSDVVAQITLSTGIYCGFAVLYDVIHPMSCSLGFNPQYKNETKSLEVHILPDTLDDFYGEELRIVIVAKLRDEKAFPSEADLKEAISQDNNQALHLLSDKRFEPLKQQLKLFR